MKKLLDEGFVGETEARVLNSVVDVGERGGVSQLAAHSRTVS